MLLTNTIPDSIPQLVVERLVCVVLFLSKSLATCYSFQFPVPVLLPQKQVRKSFFIIDYECRVFINTMWRGGTLSGNSSDAAVEHSHFHASSFNVWKPPSNGRLLAPSQTGHTEEKSIFSLLKCLCGIWGSRVNSAIHFDRHAKP